MLSYREIHRKQLRNGKWFTWNTLSSQYPKHRTWPTDIDTLLQLLEDAKGMPQRNSSCNNYRRIHDFSMWSLDFNSSDNPELVFLERTHDECWEDRINYVYIFTGTVGRGTHLMKYGNQLHTYSQVFRSPSQLEASYFETISGILQIALVP